VLIIVKKIGLVMVYETKTVSLIYVNKMVVTDKMNSVLWIVHGSGLVIQYVTQDVLQINVNKMVATVNLKKTARQAAQMFGLMMDYVTQNANLIRVDKMEMTVTSALLDVQINGSVMKSAIWIALQTNVSKMAEIVKLVSKDLINNNP
jgi:hypothetical protein